MDKILTVEEMMKVARRRVPKMFFEYADSGSYTEGTYRENESDFNKIKLNQKVAVNLEGRNLKVKMLGKEITMPVAIA
ncbi:alpha-hydroxy-acid oxidizing protein, partial [Devosia sp.]|uniref:alpha-hydroxy-acid oxidizing protein n=1 Tax=Devosia sp. TaxID=1871048 RepID=UPI0025C59B18